MSDSRDERELFERRRILDAQIIEMKRLLEHKKERERNEKNRIMDLLIRSGLRIPAAAIRLETFELPLDAFIFKLLNILENDQKLLALQKDSEIWSRLRKDLTAKAPWALQPISVPQQLPASVQKFLGFLLGYIVAKDPGRLLDFLLAHEVFYLILLKNLSFPLDEKSSIGAALSTLTIYDLYMPGSPASIKLLTFLFHFVNELAERKTQDPSILYCLPFIEAAIRSLTRANEPQKSREVISIEFPPESLSKKAIDQIFQFASKENSQPAILLPFLVSIAQLDDLKAQKTGNLEVSSYAILKNLESFDPDQFLNPSSNTWFTLSQELPQNSTALFVKLWTHLASSIYLTSKKSFFKSPCNYHKTFDKFLDLFLEESKEADSQRIQLSQLFRILSLAQFDQPSVLQEISFLDRVLKCSQHLEPFIAQVLRISKEEPTPWKHDNDEKRKNFLQQYEDNLRRTELEKIQKEKQILKKQRELEEKIRTLEEQEQRRREEERRKEEEKLQAKIAEKMRQLEEKKKEEELKRKKEELQLQIEEEKMKAKMELANQMKEQIKTKEETGKELHRNEEGTKSQGEKLSEKKREEEEIKKKEEREKLKGKEEAERQREEEKRQELKRKKEELQLQIEEKKMKASMEPTNQMKEQIKTKEETGKELHQNEEATKSQGEKLSEKKREEELKKKEEREKLKGKEEEKQREKENQMRKEIEDTKSNEGVKLSEKSKVEERGETLSSDQMQVDEETKPKLTDPMQIDTAPSTVQVDTAQSSLEISLKPHLIGCSLEKKAFYHTLTGVEVEVSNLGNINWRNEKDDNSTILHAACLAGNELVLKKLLDHPGVEYLADDKGHFPNQILHQACRLCRQLPEGTCCDGYDRHKQMILAWVEKTRNFQDK